jgi:hypothetical protein
VQGLGEGPAKLLAGTTLGHICLLERQNDPEFRDWVLGFPPPYPGVPVTALAATDAFVVAGYGNGAMRISRMDTPF